MINFTTREQLDAWLLDKTRIGFYSSNCEVFCDIWIADLYKKETVEKDEYYLLITTDTDESLLAFKFDDFSK